MTTLSASIITKNEAHIIARCLDALSFVDEIIVLDSGSTDGTQAICKKYQKVKLFETDWPGYGIQKQRALEKTSSEWVLSLDADEIITPELALAIQKATQTEGNIDGYEIKIAPFFLGYEIKHTKKWRKHLYHLRLVKKSAAHFNDDDIHEKLICKGPISKLPGRALHFTKPNYDIILHKINTYSTLTANQRFKKNKKSSIKKALYNSFKTFIAMYFFGGGILDGKGGLLLAINDAHYVFYRYMKLCTLQKNRDKSP